MMVNKNRERTVLGTISDVSEVVLFLRNSKPSPGNQEDTASS
jgi:hypothetical protein